LWYSEKPLWDGVLHRSASGHRRTDQCSVKHAWSIIKRVIAMMTTSELQFENFLDENKLPFERLAEQQTPRPDYLVQIGDAKVLFEVKEISEDDNFTKGVYSRVVGDHVRSKINEAKRQIQYGANQGIPSVLLVYNSLDPVHLFGTEDHDFITAMFGEYTIAIGRESNSVIGSYHGRNKSLDEEKNTSFSAVGRLDAISGKLKVTLFENPFAKVKLPYDALPCCFDVKRVNVSCSEHV
jgi:hypothetical protein